MSTRSARFTIISIHLDITECCIIVQCLSHIVNKCLVSFGVTIARMRRLTRAPKRNTTYRRFYRKFQKFCQLSIWLAKFTIIITQFDISEYCIIVQCLSHIVNQRLVFIGARIARMRRRTREHKRNRTGVAFTRMRKRTTQKAVQVMGQYSVD